MIIVSQSCKTVVDVNNAVVYRVDSTGRYSKDNKNEFSIVVEPLESFGKGRWLASYPTEEEAKYTLKDLTYSYRMDEDAYEFSPPGSLC